MAYTTAAQRNAFLTDAAQRLPGNEVAISIRKLIELWNAERRGYWIRRQVEADLVKHNLATVPPFSDGWIDNTVILRPHRPDAGKEVEAEAEPPFNSESQETQSDLMAGALTFADLDRALFGGNRPPLVSASKDDTLEKAQSVMMRYDFSQLPVMSGERTCRGAVSWESIARMLAYKPDAKLIDCIVPVDQLSLSDDLLSNVPKIIANGFVVTKDREGRVVGVVTTADLSAAFEDLAGPFFLIGIAEQRLRSVAESCFEQNEIENAASVKDQPRPADGLTLGELKGLFDEDENWQKLSWSVDRKVFRGLLGEVVAFRNEVMHFRGATSNPSDLAKVRNLISWLQYLVD